MLTDKEKFKVQNRTNVLGVGVSALDMDEAVELLLDARKKDRSGYICVTGVHGVIESQRDPELKAIHNRSFLTVPDGMPTVWMGREQGFVHMGRVYGPDLMLNIFEKTSALNQRKEDRGWKSEDRGQRTDVSDHKSGVISDLGSPTSDKKHLTHFLYGATEETLRKLKTNLEARFPGVQIVGTYAPPFRPLNDAEEEELRKLVAECKPDFFWVGLSTPKQERFMYAHSASLKIEGLGPRTEVGRRTQSEAGATRRQQSGNSEDGGQRTEVKGQRAKVSGQQSGSDLRPPTSDCCKFPLDAGIMLGVGAAFPIHAGLQKDSPEWIKNSGLQWLHRLCQEPRRLWRRYLYIVPTFLWLAAIQLLGIKKYDTE
ncbi:MAG: WecB/TagA/CpsF family glycosyltransferase [Pontiella sp.]